MYAISITTQLSSSGKRPSCECLSSNEQPNPYTTPSTVLNENTTKKKPVPGKMLQTDRSMSRNRESVSNMTIETASLRIDSPKMMLYSCGSTLYELKIERIVTGSVALSVLPKMRHSRSDSRGYSSRSTDASHTIKLHGCQHALLRRSQMCQQMQTT